LHSGSAQESKSAPDALPQAALVRFVPTSGRRPLCQLPVYHKPAGPIPANLCKRYTGCIAFLRDRILPQAMLSTETKSAPDALPRAALVRLPTSGRRPLWYSLYIYTACLSGALGKSLHSPQPQHGPGDAWPGSESHMKDRTTRLSGPETQLPAAGAASGGAHPDADMSSAVEPVRGA